MKRLEKFVNWLGNIDFSTKWISLSLAFILIIGSALFITYDLADMKPTEKSYSELQSVADYMVEHKSFVLPDVNECEDVEKISSYTIQRSTSGDISFSFSHKTTNAGLNLTFDEDMKLKTQERRNSTVRRFPPRSSKSLVPVDSKTFLPYYHLTFSGIKKAPFIYSVLLLPCTYIRTYSRSFSATSPRLCHNYNSLAILRY